MPLPQHPVIGRKGIVTQRQVLAEKKENLIIKERQSGARPQRSVRESPQPFNLRPLSINPKHKPARNTCFLSMSLEMSKQNTLITINKAILDENYFSPPPPHTTQGVSNLYFIHVISIYLPGPVLLSWVTSDSENITKIIFSSKAIV